MRINLVMFLVFVATLLFFSRVSSQSSVNGWKSLSLDSLGAELNSTKSFIHNFKYWKVNIRTFEGYYTNKHYDKTDGLIYVANDSVLLRYFKDLYLEISCGNLYIRVDSSSNQLFVGSSNGHSTSNLLQQHVEQYANVLKGSVRRTDDWTYYDLSFSKGEVLSSEIGISKEGDRFFQRVNYRPVKEMIYPLKEVITEPRLEIDFFGEDSYMLPPALRDLAEFLDEISREEAHSFLSNLQTYYKNFQVIKFNDVQ